MDTPSLTASGSQKSGYMPRTRLAISLMFLMNGFVTGSWAPKIPEFKDRLGIGEGLLGLLILVFGIGSLILMPIAGGFIARLGSQKVVRTTAIIVSPLLLVLTLMPNLWTASIGMLLLGGFVGAMDVAMNANAVEVEKSMRRSIMSSCHAYWSLGGLIGSALGGFIMAKAGVLSHAIFATLFCLTLIAVAWPMMLADQPHPDTAKQKLRLPMTPLPWLIGIMALFSMVPEGTVLDWGALYMRNELGASVELSGFAFAAFSATMAIMRFAGDFVRDRFGAVRTLRMSTLTALAGMLLAGLAPSYGWAIAGFAVAGIGIANMVPIAFSAAGNMPGLAPGIGLSVVTFMGYSGMLFAPSAIGFIAEHTGFAVVFLGIPVLFLAVLLLSHNAVHADVRDR
ncbi:MFS transporter [Pararhizobium sp.]|uniref:MFS transporter n=1 Tax=Pararhizobium sp. TaxID=1977563 RepID=UPI00271CEBD8|nr:MFS transporter [Pararhizobium sp.]MDO9416642.1 MFS transporter [Pararhizobium sp.]